MIGLIKKEFLMLKSNSKTLGIILIIYVILAFQSSFDISFLPPFLVVMMMMSNFSYDEINKWDAYAITLPNGRKDVVKARYIATIILNFLVTLLVMILSLIIAWKNGEPEKYMQILITMFTVFLVTILIQSFMYPIAYKLGREKAGILIFVIIFGILIVGGFLSNYIKLDIIMQKLGFLVKIWYIVIPLIIIFFLLLSYLISKKIYLKKEF